MISYDNIWKIMKKKGITQYALIKRYHVSPGQITRLKRNESVSTHTIEMFCRILNCKVSDIMEYIPDEKEQTKKKPDSVKARQNRQKQKASCGRKTTAGGFLHVKLRKILSI